MKRPLGPATLVPAILRRPDERKIRSLFRISLVLKGAFSVLEIVGGLLGYFIDQHDLVRLVTRITQEELTEDPQDFIAQYVVQGAAKLSLSSQHFASAYLLSHGLVKTWLIAGLLRKKLWYYPVAIVVFSAFIAYQLFRFHVSHSIWLLVLTMLDAVVIVLTLQEYRYLMRPERAQK